MSTDHCDVIATCSNQQLFYRIAFWQQSTTTTLVLDILTPRFSQTKPGRPSIEVTFAVMRPEKYIDGKIEQKLSWNIGKNFFRCQIEWFVEQKCESTCSKYLAASMDYQPIVTSDTSPSADLWRLVLPGQLCNLSQLRNNIRFVYLCKFLAAISLVKSRWQMQ